MIRAAIGVSAVAVAASVAACAHLGGRPITSAEASEKNPFKHLTVAERRAAIRRAAVWAPSDVSAMDLRMGPQRRDSLAPNANVTCTFVERPLRGASPKFSCEIENGDDVKVKYGRENGEVYAEVAATRLLWALGFGADAMYPVRVVCVTCPLRLWRGGGGREDAVFFDPASIERKMPGDEMESEKTTGWSWPELDLVDEREGGASRAQRDALKLLAVFLQHTDTKPEQQRLLCVDRGTEKDARAECRHPLMMLNDLGLTFGRANTWNRNPIGSANFEKWSTTPVWKDAKSCIGNLPRSRTGTLENPSISESGRSFLADRLAQLSDGQLRDLFDVARFSLRARDGRGAGPGASVEEWVHAFKGKRDEIANRRCA